MVSSPVALKLCSCGFLVLLDWLATQRQILLLKLLFFCRCLTWRSHLDYSSLIRTCALKQWQQSWNSQTENMLHVIEPRMNVINLSCLARRDGIIIHRFKIRAHVSYAWTLITTGNFPSVLGLSSQINWQLEWVQYQRADSPVTVFRIRQIWHPVHP